MLFDSHCHPQFPHYDQDRDEMIKRTLEEGIFMICVGTDIETSKKAVELANKYEGIWATVGLHPNDNLSEEFNPDIYEKLLNQKKVVGFGEIGLDYYRTKNPEDRNFQEERFKKQLDLAIKIGKPLIIHCRDPLRPRSEASAHQNLIENLRLPALGRAEARPGKVENSASLRGVIHSFTGTLEEAKKYLDLGFYLGFNGIITFANQYDETIKYIPLKNILLETDAPYLTPLPFRGKRNEPAFVKYVAEKIAELKSLSYDQVAEQTFANTKKLFEI